MEFQKQYDTYDKTSYLQKYIAKSLLEIIKKHNKNTPKEIIEIGCGNGNLTKILSKQYHKSIIYAIDKSSNMISLCKRNIDNNNIIYISLDAEKIQIKKKVDLITSSMSLHWMKNISIFLQKIKTLTNDIAFSIPINGTFKEWDVIYKQYNNYSPLIPFPSIDAIVECFQDKNIKLKIETETIKQFFIDPLSFARNIKNLGVYNKNTKNNKALYRIIKKHKTSIEISYKIAYCIALIR